MNNDKILLSATEILTYRARELAIPVSTSTEEETGFEVLEFLLSGEHYAIGMEFVKEVAFLKEITYLPGTPSFILGIVSLHGAVLSIVDLRTVFKMPSKGLTEFNRIIILSEDVMTFGILADAIIRTRTINPELISRSPPTINGQGAIYLTGIFPGPLIVIDGKALISDPRMVVGD